MRAFVLAHLRFVRWVLLVRLGAAKTTSAAAATSVTTYPRQAR